MSDRDGQQILLEMVGMRKQYPGVLALDDVGFNLRAGEVHALVGENGAGKSTLMKLMAGAERPDGGTIYLRGEPQRFAGPLEAMRAGISIIYQEFNLVPTMSVEENIYLGRQPVHGAGFVNWRALRAGASELLGRLRADVHPGALVEALSVAQQQMVEIAKAVALDASVIAMDEPTASLTDREIERLFELIDRLRAEGKGIIYISHRLEEIERLADRVTVMRDGRWVCTEPREQLPRDEMVRRMVGRELSSQYPVRAAAPGEVLLDVRGLSRRGVLHDVSFSVRAGEIVGLAGLVGSGRTEVARALFGVDARDAGEITLHGEPVVVGHPAQAVAQGLGFATEDRKGQGLVLGMTVRENTTLASLPLVSRLGFVSAAREVELAERYRADLQIRTPGIEQAVQNLSGGNQQKVVLAKWLCREARLLILDEPTRGIDVGAKAEIYALMNQLTAQGVGILMISSELDEVLGMADRILVMREGRLAGELSSAQATAELVMRLATGVEAASPAAT